MEWALMWHRTCLDTFVLKSLFDVLLFTIPSNSRMAYRGAADIVVK